MGTRLWLALLVPGLLMTLVVGLGTDAGIGTVIVLLFLTLAGAIAVRMQYETAVDDFVSGYPVPAAASSTRLRRTADLFEAVLGTMIDGVVVVDRDQTLMYVNRAARSLLDLRDRVVEGKLLTEVSRSAALQDLIEKVLRTETHQRTELQLVRRKLTLAVSAAVLKVDPTPGVLIVLHDVTELRRLEMMRRDFVSNVSHELKTPLTSIQAYADTLLSGGIEDTTNRVVFVERIVEQAERLQSLILDLLRLARIESDEVEMEIHPVNVSDLVAECIDEQQAVADSKGVDLRMEPSPAPVMVMAEEEGLRTVLSNLISNGVNYTPSGGSVTVQWGQREREVHISVIDTGVGIAREHQSRVFERFYRVDRARSRALGGTGLGLSIVKHLVQVMHGRVELVSEQGQGSQFSVWLPAMKNGVPESP